MQGQISQGHQPTNSGSVDSAAIPAFPAQDSSTLDTRQTKSRTMKKSTQVCRFYNTKKGCRAQDQCPYLHVQKVNDVEGSRTAASHTDIGSSSAAGDSPVNSSVERNIPTQRTPHTVRERAPVSRPVPSLQQKDPRQFQINQVVRRFSPLHEEKPHGTILRLKLKPSDPDFPFDLDELECALTVPPAYPKDGKPSLKIENKGIPRGFQINVERGFDSLCSGSSTRTLLQLLNDLDRHLEQFLTNEKAQTIKIVANRRQNEPSKEEIPISEPSTSVTPVMSTAKVSDPPSWTVQQKTDAKVKRDVETRQLDARMSRVPLYSSSKDGVSFNVPLQIPKPSRLPTTLQSLKEVSLIVPALYDLEPCRIKLKGVSRADAEDVELAFEQHASTHRDMTLMAHINYLTQNIHTMAMSSMISSIPPIDTVVLPKEPTIEPTEKMQQDPKNDDGIVDEDRPHLRFVSHPPPEWRRQRADHEESESDTSDEYDSESDVSDISDDMQSQAGGASIPAVTTTGVLEKGVLLSFPHLELHGIELLELRNISLSVKCDRCKEILDVKNIKAAEPTSTTIRTESCNKCASPISASFRSEPMHINSIKAGYLDLEGCTVVDMLPSHFLPTCSECSTTHPLPGVISVRGESPIAICRECHHHLNFKIPEIKFLRVSSNDPRLNLPLRSKRKKENLGISAGSELPDRGRCKHYSKSYRWFRFSCCNRVYACDRCHDEKEEHPNEHANRMICGWCSREQNYRPEDCNACRRSVVRRTGGGFWEGGKGTRDKAKMSRKDPRKFKRIGGGAKGGEK